MRETGRGMALGLQREKKEERGRTGWRCMLDLCSTTTTVEKIHRDVTEETRWLKTSEKKETLQNVPAHFLSSSKYDSISRRRKEDGYKHLTCECKGEKRLLGRKEIWKHG